MISALSVERCLAQASEVLIEAVVASVDGKPITLQEVGRRLSPPRKLSLSEASMDLTARQALDQIVLERVIEAEAEARKLKVSEADVKTYIDEVARRNQLSVEGFERALSAQGKRLDEYEAQVRLEILKSRLVGQLVQSGFGVTAQEVQDYLREHPELSKSGSKVKLSQIFVSFARYSQAEAEERVGQVQEKFKLGQEFGKLALEFSDSPDAREGGSLGVVAQEDLSPLVFDAVFPLKDGDLSTVVRGSDGLRIFLLEKRFVEEQEHEDALLEEVKKTLSQQKLESKVQDFFSSELLKHHVIDKKI